MTQDFSRSLFVNSSIPAGNTVTTNSEVNFASNCTMAAGLLSAADAIRIYASGTISTGALSVGTLVLRIKFGSTILAATTALALPLALSVRRWKIDAIVSINSIGASGEAETHGDALVYSGLTASVPMEIMSTSPVAFNSTVEQTLQLSAQFSALVAGNSLTLRQLILERWVD